MRRYSKFFTRFEKMFYHRVKDFSDARKKIYQNLYQQRHPFPDGYPKIVRNPLDGNMLKLYFEDHMYLIRRHTLEKSLKNSFTLEEHVNVACLVRELFALSRYIITIEKNGKDFLIYEGRIYEEEYDKVYSYRIGCRRSYPIYLKLMEFYLLKSVPVNFETNAK